MKRYTTLTTIGALLLMVFTMVSCQKDPQPGGTAVQSMAGEWWVQLDRKGAFYHFSTYNTASNLGSEMWLDDLKTFYEMKGKVNVDLNALTFSGKNIKNEYYNITFNVDSGKIIHNGSKGPASKAVTDSITFVAEFSDDPGTKYRLSGYRRTRFADDDH
jgi:hypothetical protein